MQRSRLKSLTLIASLAVLTVAVLAATGRGKPPAHPPADPLPAGGSGITLSGHLVQTHVLKGSPGRVGLELTLAAAGPAAASADDRGIDFVVVLDRSGSMEGAKLEYARQSLQHLLASLNARDRFALFSYADAVQKQCDLLPVTAANRSLMHAAVAGIRSGGATNLGEGLRAGIELITAASRPGHPGRVILISDGLANRGITDPAALAGMAATAAGREFAVSAVGVGSDFNEVLMTRIADRGAGSYYYLDNPSAFAEVFRREAVSAKTAAATGISVSIPLPPGVRLVDAAGYPVSLSDGRAVFYPGSLQGGQHLVEQSRTPPATSRMYLYLMNNMFDVNVRWDQPGPVHFAYSLRSHEGDWQAGKADEFGWDIMNPLVAVDRLAASNQGQLPASDTVSWRSTAPNVACTTLKPAEANGAGLHPAVGRDPRARRPRRRVSLPFLPRSPRRPRRTWLRMTGPNR